MFGNSYLPRLFQPFKPIIPSNNRSHAQLALLLSLTHNVGVACLQTYRNSWMDGQPLHAPVFINGSQQSHPSIFKGGCVTFTPIRLTERIPNLHIHRTSWKDVKFSHLSDVMGGYPLFTPAEIHENIRYFHAHRTSREDAQPSHPSDFMGECSTSIPIRLHGMKPYLHAHWTS